MEHEKRLLFYELFFSHPNIFQVQFLILTTTAIWLHMSILECKMTVLLHDIKFCYMSYKKYILNWFWIASSYREETKISSKEHHILSVNHYLTLSL